MGVHSGKFGVLNGQSTVRNWNITDTQTPQKYVASNTRCGPGRIEGVHDWTGSFAQYGHTPLVMPGDNFSFLGYTAPDNDTLNGTGTKYSGTAIVESIVVNWNWGAGEILNTVVNFAGNGALVATDSGAAISDASSITVPPVAGTKITYSATEWDNLLSANLTISSENQAYVNSSTAGWTKRLPGIIDWTLAVVEQNSKRDAPLPDKGDDLDLKLYIDGSNYWHLKWGHVRDFSGINVDRESGAILQRTVNIDMTGFSGGSTGQIRKPGAGTNWWPV